MVIIRIDTPALYSYFAHEAEKIKSGETIAEVVTNDETSKSRKIPRIVLLEDEKALARLFEQCLQDWFEKIELVTLANGEETWKELARAAPDLLILDWAHPGLTGHEILRQLSLSQAKFPILLTSEFFEKNLQLFTDRGLKLGFLPKPFGIREFWSALNQLVGPSDHPEIQALVKTVEETRVQE